MTYLPGASDLTPEDLPNDLDRISLRGVVAFALRQSLLRKGLEIVTITVAPEEVEEAESLLRQFAPCLEDRALLRNLGFPPCFRPNVGKILEAISVVTER